MVLKRFKKKFEFGMIFMGVTGWYQSLGLSELEEHSWDFSLKSRKRFSK